MAVTEQEVRSGGCQCGAIRYQIRGELVALYVCHCRECQMQSASAFGISAIVPRSRFSVLKGQVHSWTRTTDSGRQLRCAFCPTCGSRVWHEQAVDSAMLSVKGGSLDHPADLAGAIHIWTVRALPGVIIPADARTFEKEPN